MSTPRNFFGAAALALSFVLLLPNLAVAGCHVQVVSSISPTDPLGGSGSGPITPSSTGVPANLNNEGLTERVSDVLIYDDSTIGTANCFAVGNQIRLTYNAALSLPASISSATAANFDVYDNSSSGLTIQASSAVGFSANTAQTVISINVLQGGTAATTAGGITSTGNGVGSAVRVKNLRVDASPLAAGTVVNVTVSSQNTAAMPAPATSPVGTALATIAPGAGFTQFGHGTQSSGGTLDTPAIFHFAEGFGNAFRLAGGSCASGGSTCVSGVFDDIATNDTSLIFDVGTTLPYGVSLAFPSTIETSASAGLGGIKFQLRPGFGSCLGPANCFAIYDTVANGPAPSSITMTTGAVPNSGANGSLPAIGVLIANPSGFGTVSLAVSFGPAASFGGTSNDDINPNAVPRYVTANAGILSHISRQIIEQTRFVVGDSSVAGPITSGLSVTSLAPNGVIAGSSGLSLTVTGANFVSGAVVRWNGSSRPTTFVNSAQLVATISASDLASAGTAQITVVNPDTTVSNAASFTVGANPVPNSALTYLLPHVVSGAGYATKITIVNISNSQNSVVVNFLSQTGTLLQSTSYDVPAGGTVRVSTPDAERYGPSLTKWAIVGSQLPVLPNLYFEYIPTPGSNVVENGVGFNNAQALTDFSLPVEFQPASASLSVGKTVGLALANGNATSASATLQLVDGNGNVVATTTVNLPPFGQWSQDLSKLGAFQAALPSGDFVGSVTVSATSPISAIALEDNNGPFSATPVGSGRAH
jgi:hypothetical protein